MSESPIQTIRVDRYLIAKLLTHRAMVEAVEHVGFSIQDIAKMEPLLAKVLELIFERIPAERGAVLFAGQRPQDLEPAAFRGPPFNSTPKLAATAFRDQTAILAGNVLCVPLWLYGSSLGAISLDAGKGRHFTTEYLHLLIAIAWEIASPLRSMRRIETLQVENEQFSQYLGMDRELIGNGKLMSDLRKMIRLVAASDKRALIRGEMGTGKELVARAIHRYSSRKDRPFVAINCAAIPENLLENELFGHERGAFSGAVGKAGRFEIANGGTLFLDEIGDMKYPMQSTLLRVLQEGEFERVGGTQTIRVDVRVVAATNRDLPKAIKDGTFREDLYHRLNVVELHTPALRDIPEEIPLLVDHFIQLERHFHIVDGVSREAMERILQYKWPGNMRELKNVIDRALLYREPGLIEVRHLPALLQESLTPETGVSTLEENEKAAIERALRKTNGNVAAAAALLEISRRQLYRLIHKYGVDLP